MPLDHGYGVAIGTFASFTREDPSDFGTWYHGKLRIDTPAGQYEAALDVDTPSGVGVSYRVVDRPDDQRHPGPRAHWRTASRLWPRTPVIGCARLRAEPDPARRLGGPPAAIGRSSALFVAMAHRGVGAQPARPGCRPTPPVVRRGCGCAGDPSRGSASDGDNALDVLEPLRADAARIYIFGEPFTTGLGVHNVHYNQGDPPGSHQAENGDLAGRRGARQSGPTAPSRSGRSSSTPSRCTPATTACRSEWNPGGDETTPAHHGRRCSQAAE